MSLPEPYLRSLVVIIRTDSEGRESRIIKPDGGLISMIFGGYKPHLTACLEPVSTKFGTYSMYVVRQKGNN